jgi:rare lipoprotein A
MVQVRNVANGHTVTVRINNRGPYCKGRILDLSKAAAQQLQMISSGTAKVELVVLEQQRPP